MNCHISFVILQLNQKFFKKSIDKSFSKWYNNKALSKVEYKSYTAEWSSSVARRAHNPKVVGSNPASATKNKKSSYSVKPSKITFHTNFALNSLTNVLKSCIIEYRIRKHSLSHSDVCVICVIVRKVCLQTSLTSGCVLSFML